MRTPALAALMAHGHDVTLPTSTTGALAGQHPYGLREALILSAPSMKVSPVRAPAHGILRSIGHNYPNQDIGQPDRSDIPTNHEPENNKKKPLHYRSTQKNFEQRCRQSKGFTQIDTDEIFH